MVDIDIMEELSLETLPGEIASEEEELDPSRLDKLTKRKIGNIPGILDWIPDAEKQRASFPYGIAGSILLILGFGVGLWLRPKTGTGYTTAHSVEPMLCWQSDTGAGDSIRLKQMAEGRAYPAKAIQIARMGNEFFILQGPNETGTDMDTLVYYFNVNGDKNIQLFFPDSTRVELSPNSTVSFRVYPRGTRLKEKQLACNGEALFDVHPNCQIPTIVKTLRQEIRVLGTVFESRDYKTEDSSAVFCYSGKVKVVVKDSSTKTAIVDSAQRATMRRGRGIKVTTNDFTGKEFSSPELLFDFSNEDLDDAMSEIARWYGMSNVEYIGSIDRKTRGKVLIGQVSRYLTLQQLLSILDRYDLHFSIQGNTILVRGSGGHPDHNR